MTFDAGTWIIGGLFILLVIGGLAWALTAAYLEWSDQWGRK